MTCAMLAVARRAVPGLFRGVEGARGTTQGVIRRGFCDGAASEEDTTVSEAEKAEVGAFFNALGIEPDKYVAKSIPDMATLLHAVKTETLKKEGMTIKDRKKLLAHVEKYKKGLWAPGKQ